MKKIFLFILVLLVFISCGTTKKLQQADIDRFIDSSAVTNTEKVKTQTLVDTTKTEKNKITITEIEFFPPVEDCQPSDTRKVQSPPTKRKEPKGSSADVKSFGDVHGNIKSIKQTVIESSIQEKGESDDSKETEKDEKSSAVKKDESKVVKESEPTGDPYKWRYIFYILSLLVAVSVFLYIKRVPVLNLIKKILSGIRRIF